MLVYECVSLEKWVECKKKSGGGGFREMRTKSMGDEREKSGRVRREVWEEWESRGKKWRARESAWQERGGAGGLWLRQCSHCSSKCPSFDPLSSFLLHLRQIRCCLISPERENTPYAQRRLFMLNNAEMTKGSCETFLSLRTTLLCLELVLVLRQWLETKPEGVHFIAEGKVNGKWESVFDTLQHKGCVRSRQCKESYEDKN